MKSCLNSNYDNKNHTLFGYISLKLFKGTIIKEFFLNLLLQSFFLSILSKHVEHNKWPFFLQNVFVDLSISFLHIKHLKIGDIKLSFRIKVFLLIIKIEAN